ncbi:MAG: DNA cytosine methyltransferase, partial [Candidatus Bathyarchaeia archaeon]
FEVFEGTALPDLNDEYRSIMEDYRDVAGRVETKEALLWKTRVWKKLSFDAVKDYLMINNITPKDDEEVKRAFEVHVAVLKKMGYYKNRLEGKHFADGSNNVPNELKEVLERLKMIPPGENHLFVRGTRWEVEGRGISLIYRRLHPLKPSPTIVAYGGGGTWGYHYKRSRGKLTNRERARLQTFPDWFLFSGSASEVRAQIGEAVPPLLGEKIAEAVKTILSSKKG